MTVKSDTDQTALHIACSKGDPKLVMYLMSVCSSVKDTVDVAGRTPLLSAVEKSHAGVVAALLRNGVKVPPKCAMKSKLEEAASVCLVQSYLSTSTTLTSSATRVIQLIDLAQGGLTPLSTSVFTPFEVVMARVLCRKFGSKAGLNIASYLGRGFIVHPLARHSISVTTAMAVDSNLKRRVTEALSGDSSGSDDEFIRPMPRKRQRAEDVAVVRARNMRMA